MENTSSVGVLTVLNMYKIIVIMMYKFLVPMKPIVLRRYEIEMLPIDTVAFLLGQGTRSFS